jgi:hypothetical protein
MDDDVFLSDEGGFVVVDKTSDQSSLLPKESSPQKHPRIYSRQPQSIAFSSRKQNQNKRNVSLLFILIFLSIGLMVLSWILLNPHGDVSFGRKLGKWIQNFKYSSTTESSFNSNNRVTNQ